MRCDGMKDKKIRRKLSRDKDGRNRNYPAKVLESVSRQYFLEYLSDG